MGGPGSGGYKLAPGDTETHSAWDVLEHEDGNMQVRSILPDARGRGLMGARNYHRSDASTALEKWRSTRLASELIYSNVMDTSTP